MKIVIISDIHDNLVNLKKCLDWCRANEVEKIICCGDVTNSETLSFLANNFRKEIFLVRGNMEIYGEEEIGAYDNFVYGGRTAIFEIGGKKVGVCHEPFLIKEVFAKVLPLNKGELDGVGSEAFFTDPTHPPLIKGRRMLDIIFYGHTHKPWIEEKDGTQIVNPGTLGGVFSRATFAFWDASAGKLELKILDIL